MCSNLYRKRGWTGRLYWHCISDRIFLDSITSLSHVRHLKMWLYKIREVPIPTNHTHTLLESKNFSEVVKAVFRNTTKTLRPLISIIQIREQNVPCNTIKSIFAFLFCPACMHIPPPSPYMHMRAHTCNGLKDKLLTRYHARHVAPINGHMPEMHSTAPINSYMLTCRQETAPISSKKSSG